MRFLSFLLCFFFLINSAHSAVEIAPARGTFTLSLLEAPAASGIERVTGSWVQEVNVSECLAYNVKSQFNMTFFLSDGRQVVVKRGQESREDKTGDAFSFAILETQDGQIQEDTIGTARRADGQVILKTTKPDDATFKYSDEIVFPVEHVRSLIVKAMSGLKNTDHILLEGFQGGKTAYRVKTEVVKEKMIPRVTNGLLAVLDAKRLRRWRVKNDFIKKPLYDTQTATDKPEYSNEFTIYENGVAADFIFRFAAVTVKAEMTDLTFLEKTAC